MESIEAKRILRMRIVIFILAITTLMQAIQIGKLINRVNVQEQEIELVMDNVGTIIANQEER